MAGKQDELTRALGSAPPAPLKKLSAADRKHLAGVIDTALARHNAAVEEAETSLLQHVPRPLRPAVRSFLKGSK